MNQEKRAREIEQFFITITRASAALEVALKRDFGLSLGEYRVLDEVASTGEIGILAIDPHLSSPCQPQPRCAHALRVRPSRRNNHDYRLR